MSTSKDSVFWVGIDLHQSSLMLAAYRGWASEPEVYRELDSRSPAVGRVIRGLQKKARVSAVYEASGCGYWLARRMKRWGVDCQVVAPSLIPRLAGDRVKTDKRDAQKLATMHRADVLTYVRVPSLEEERVRRLVRAREGIRRDIHRSKQRILKVLQSLGHVYEPGKKKRRAAPAPRVEPGEEEVDAGLLALAARTEAACRGARVPGPDGSGARGAACPHGGR